MITIYCALYQEAQYLIQYYELKKAPESRHFQVFCNEDKHVRMVITGVGKTNAAVAVAEISTIYPPTQDDIMINYGSCAGGEAIISGSCDSGKMSGSESGVSGELLTLGSVIMVHKLTDVESGRTFYPDMIYNHPFEEGEVETSVHVYAVSADASDGASVKADVTGQNADVARRMVHDMEAAAFYEAGSFYYGPHQMMFIKVVTDYGVTQVEQIEKSVVDVKNEKVSGKHADSSDNLVQERENFARENFIQIMQQSGETVVQFIDAVQTLLLEDSSNRCKPWDAPEPYVDEAQLAADLHCSVTMQAELAQLLRYWKLAGIDGKALIDTYYKKEQLPCKDKRMGRRILDELQNKWL